MQYFAEVRRNVRTKCFIGLLNFRWARRDSQRSWSELATFNIIFGGQCIWTIFQKYLLPATYGNKQLRVYLRQLFCPESGKKRHCGRAARAARRCGRGSLERLPPGARALAAAARVPPAGQRRPGREHRTFGALGSVQVFFFQGIALPAKSGSASVSNWPR